MNDVFGELVARAQSSPGGDGVLSREECLAATRARAIACRKAARHRHDEGASGSDVVHELAEAADEIVRGVFHFALSAVPVRRAVLSRVALCALGGYGRGELSPYSDLDVCLLYDGPLDEPIRALNAFLIPFLWDSGFAVGYSIHSVEEANALAREDLLAFTRCLESRLLAGESTTFARHKLHIRGLQSGDYASRFIEQKIRDRYQGLGDEHRDLFAPEPNVKESAGGLRDFHTALWLLMMSYGLSTLDEAVGQGIITQEEHLDFVDGLDFIWRIRNELHFNAGKAEDRLTYPNQMHVSRAFGYAGATPSRFMQDYYTAAGKLRRFLRLVARACHYSSVMLLPDAGMPVAQEYAIENGELFVGAGDPRWFVHNPVRLMEVYWLCARHRVPLSHPSERLVTENLFLVNDTFRENDLARRFFMALCNRPFQAGHALRQMAATGLLGRYIPEFRDVENVVRYEDFHSYPVGEHTLRAIEALEAIPDMRGAVGRCLREALENLTDPYILVMAILFHDLGKVQGDVHVEESVRLARRICRRMGMAEEDEERIAFLVQHHTLMTNISQYRDIDDEHILAKFAETMKTEGRLRALFVLTYADISAVGPGVWNEWKGALLLQLYLRTVKRLLGRAETADEEFWTTPKADLVRAATRPNLRTDVHAHLKGLGQRYFVAFQPEEIAGHLACIDEARKRGLAVRSGVSPLNGMTELVVCTRDSHGLFSKMAGCFSSQLVDIRGAVLFTRPDGWVVDCFTLADAQGMRPLTEAQLERLEEVLRAVLLEGANVQEYVDRSRRRLFALLQPRFPVPTRIWFDNDTSLTQTVIDIETGDRTGLLYDITHAMSEMGLDISTARIVTDAHRVRDSFYVTQNGEKLMDEQALAAVRDAIHFAIHPPVASEVKGGTG